MPNRLSSARSPYLREAAHQPVDWSPWDEEAFARAKKEGKPVLLDIGAVWCHWCHVMDHESYEDPATARIVNELFVAVKVDRDERPDVDARYQKAVSAITGQGGWPLTAFLTPEGEVFFGGTYFPPKDAHGRPGFPRLLREVSRFFHERPDDVREQARRIRVAIAPRSMRAEGALPRRAIQSVRDAAYTHFDPVHGGFGTAPKFQHTSTVDLLLRRGARGEGGARPGGGAAPARGGGGGRRAPPGGGGET
ncbi:MAG: thioredoxin domain-containing protein, partial [Methanobacteriota archaeon]